MQGSLFVHELTEVRPGTALDYLAAVREERVPLLAEYGHRLVGLYEVLMNDYEVCTIWATTAEAHVRAGKARDVARGLASESDVEGDPRFEKWHARAREWCVHWREELMTPHVGIAVRARRCPRRRQRQTRVTPTEHEGEHMDLTWLPAWQIGDLIEKREVSPVEVTEHFLGRAEELDPVLRCYRTLDASGAREQAKRAEEAVLRGDELGRLHGIPVSVKEHIAVAGLPFFPLALPGEAGARDRCGARCPGGPPPS